MYELNSKSVVVEIYIVVVLSLNRGPYVSLQHCGSYRYDSY
jgi:hypothetical protein